MPPLLQYGVPAGPTPSRPLLLEYVARQLAAVAVVAAAAWLTHQAGLSGHVWPYVVMAGAIVPQALLAAVALGDEHRRTRLRTSTRPAPVPGLLAIALGCAAVAGWLLDQPVVATGAAVVAATGLLVSALPAHVHVPRDG